jgi:hypothetical protein
VLRHELTPRILDAARSSFLGHNNAVWNEVHALKFGVLSHRRQIPGVLRALVACSHEQRGQFFGVLAVHEVEALTVVILL